MIPNSQFQSSLTHSFKGRKSWNYKIWLNSIPFNKALQSNTTKYDQQMLNFGQQEFINRNLKKKIILPMSLKKLNPSKIWLFWSNFGRCNKIFRFQCMGNSKYLKKFSLYTRSRYIRVWLYFDIKVYNFDWWLISLKWFKKHSMHKSFLFTG